MENKFLQDFATQGQRQFSMVEDRFKTVKSLLDRKLRKGELTYLRYLGASEGVFVAVLDNLERAVSLMNSNQAIDDNYISERIDALEGTENNSEADTRELATLVERKTLAEKQREMISTLLTENEVAITKMDQLNGSLAELTIIKGRGIRKLEQAIEDMEELASRVYRYAEDG